MLQNVWDSSCCQESSASLLLDQQNLGRKEVGSDTWLVVMDHQNQNFRYSISKKGSFSSIFANLTWLVTSTQCKEHIRYLIFQSLTVLSAFSFFHFDKSSNICKNGNADLWTNWKKLKLGFWIPIIPNPSL